MESSALKRRRYREPPLAEAVAELRFDPGGPWDQTLPGLIYERLVNTFPSKRQVNVLDEQLVVQEETIEKQLTPVERLQLRTEDERALVSLSPHYLSVSRLPPYKEWEEFQPLIEEAVGAYRAVAEPTGILRAGLRAVNIIKVPLREDLELSEYFNFYPFIGPDLPQKFGTFISGIQIPYENERDVLRMQLADQPPQGERATILLDIDYFLNRANEIDFDGWNGWLESAHVRVRDVFEGAITPSLRELFGEETD